MEGAAARRRYEELHKEAPYHDGSFTTWSPEASLEHPYHYMDGVTFFVADQDLEPDATWLLDPLDVALDGDEQPQLDATPDDESEDPR